MADTNNYGVGQMGVVAGGAIPVGKPVKFNGTTKNSVVVCDAITDLCMGIYEGVGGTGTNGAAVANDNISIRQYGKAKCLAGATITANGEVMVEATSGDVVDAAGSTARSIGIALEAAADGDFFEAFVKLPNLKGPPNS